MRLFIFPKFFEFYKLIKYLGEDILILKYFEDTQICTIKYNLREHKYTKHDKDNHTKNVIAEIQTIVIDSSDIEFHELFRNISTKILEIEQIMDLKYNTIILLGSCGVSKSGMLESIYLINKAYKMGRGKIGILNKYSFFDKIIDKNKSIEMRINDFSLDMYLNSNITKHESITTNFIIEDDDIFKSLNIDRIYDMETYNFYDICKNILKDRCYHCIRFPTDVVINENSIITKYELYNSIPLSDTLKQGILKIEGFMKNNKVTSKSEGILLGIFNKYFRLFILIKNYIRNNIDVKFEFLEIHPWVSNLNTNKMKGLVININKCSKLKIMNTFKYKMDKINQKILKSITGECKEIEVLIVKQEKISKE